MYSCTSIFRSLANNRSWLFFFLLFGITPHTFAQSFFESPTQGSFESGVSLIRGWVCDANQVEISIDGGARRQTAYGTKRGTTEPICGDDDNGFGYTINWNEFKDGLHNIRVFADGIEIANVNFVVTTLGEIFRTDLSGQFDLPNFPDPGRSPTIRWSQAQQNFVLSSSMTVPDIPNPPSNPRAFLESPTQGSFESGVGLIRGWVCEANTVEIIIDGGEPRQTAYGTKRGDTIEICGDDDNGFGLTFNWNQIRDGVHNLRALADGVEFANVNFVVTTLGRAEDFVEGLSGEFQLANFPNNGDNTTVRWSEPSQNFTIVGSTVTGPKLGTIAAVTDPQNPLIAAMLGNSGAGGLGVQALKNVNGEPTRLTAVAWEDSDPNLFANLMLDDNGLPATYSDSLGIEARFSNFTQNTYQVRFVDAQGTLILGPLTVPIDFGLLLPLQQLAATLQNPAQSSLIDVKQLQQRHIAAAARGPFSLDGVALDAIWAGGVATGGMLCSLESALAGITNIPNIDLIVAAACDSPLIAGFAELAGASSGSDPLVQSALKFSEDVAEAPCDPTLNSGAGCLARVVDELQAREPSTEPEPEAPLAPTSVSASDGTFEDQVRVSWSIVSNATSYEVYRSNSSGDTGSLQGTINGSTFDDTSVDPGTTYWYRVRACNNAGCSGFSVADDGFAVFVPPNPDLPPLSPDGVSASDGADTQVNINWNPVSDAIFYEVFRSDAADMTGFLIGSPSDPSFMDELIEFGRIYWYRVRACNNAGCSEFSDPDSGFGTGEDILPVLSPPTGVSASDGSFSDRVEISWNAADLTTFYEVFRSDSANTEGSLIGVSSDTRFSDTSASPDSPHWYRVKSCRPSFCSELSAADQGFRSGVNPAQDTQWGAITDICCREGTLTLEVTIENVLRRSVVSACPLDSPNPKPTFEGFVTTSPGTKDVFATASGICISQTFEGPLDFSAGTCYEMRLDTDPLDGRVKLLQVPVNCPSN